MVVLPTFLGYASTSEPLALRLAESMAEWSNYACEQNRPKWMAPSTSTIHSVLMTRRPLRSSMP